MHIIELNTKPHQTVKPDMIFFLQQLYSIKAQLKTNKNTNNNNSPRAPKSQNSPRADDGYIQTLELYLQVNPSISFSIKIFLFLNTGSTNHLGFVYVRTYRCVTEPILSILLKRILGTFHVEWLFYIFLGRKLSNLLRYLST